MTWWRRGQTDERIEKELRFHIDRHAADLMAKGYSPEEARRQAHLELGGMAQVKENCRDARGKRKLEDLAQDIRYALRAFRRNPAFTTVAVLCLALGIGANSTIYSLTMEAIFAHPSVRDPQSILYVQLRGSDSVSVAVWRVLHDQGNLPQMAGVQEIGEANWRLADETHRVYAAHVTDNFFETIGVPLLFGQPVKAGDRNTTVISYGFWQRWLHGESDVAGRTLVLDGQSYTITGILPRDHRSLVGIGISPDVYLPVQTETEQVSLYMRIPEGLNRQAVRSQLVPVCRELDRIMPRPANTWEQSIRLSGVMGLERIEAWGLLPVAAFFAVLMVVVTLVLLVACTNLTSLLLARASSRRQEFATRVALGASRGRIVRQLMAETFLLAMLGATAGLILNLALTRVLNTISVPVPLPIRLFINPDWRLIGYLILVTVLCTLLAGLMPALKAASGAIHSVLKQDQGQVGRARWSLRSVLVVGQLAISALLLLTGALFTRNLVKAETTDLGFNVNSTLWADMRLVPGKYPTVEQLEQLSDSALDRLRNLPGVESATAVGFVPMNDVASFVGDLNIQTDTPEPSPTVVDSLDLNWVGGDYFRTMDIPILQGRTFLPSEWQGTPEVGIVNEEMARRLFGNRSAVGHAITVGVIDSHPILIVGVARNSKYYTLGERNKAALYKAYAQGNFRGLHSGLPGEVHFLVRASNYPSALIKPVNDALGDVDPTAAIETKTMRSSLAFALLPSRAGAIITGSIGALGVALAAIGLFGLLLYATTARTKEIGLRMALGGTRRNITRMIVGRSLVFCGMGLAVGLLIAAFAARPLGVFLVPGLSPHDPASFAIVCAVLLAVSLLATLVPLARALSIDPMMALRHE
jgi:predicted permease